MARMSPDVTHTEPVPTTRDADAAAGRRSSMVRAPAAYRQLVLLRPRLTLALLLGVLAFVALYIPQFELEASADSLLLEDDPDLRRFREVSARYGTQDLLLVTFTPEGDLFADESMERLASLSDELAAVPSVGSITSILNVPLLESADVPLADLATNVQTLTSPSVDRDRAREELVNSPVFRELIISENGQTTALALSLEYSPEQQTLLTRREELREKRRNGSLSRDETAELARVSAEYDALYDADQARVSRDIARIREIIMPYEQYGTIHLGGVSMIADDMISFVRSDLIVFGIGVLVFLVVVLSVIFRERRWVVLPLVSCVYAAVFMIGLLGLAGWPVTIISSNFLALMLIVTISMNIHLAVRYRQLARQHPTEEHGKLVETTLCRMVWPCLYTALTTILGFASLVVSDIKPVQDFGWMMCWGLTVAFVVSFSLFPALLLVLGRPPKIGGSESPPVLLEWLATLTERHGGAILAASAVLAIGSGIGITRLTVENSFIDYFRQDTEIYQGMKLIDERLGGTTPLDVIINFDGAGTPAVDVAASTPADAASEGNAAGETSEPIDEGSDEDDFDYLDEYALGDAGPAYWFTEQRIERIKQVDAYLNSLPAVGKVISLASIIHVAEKLNGGEPLDTIQLGVLYNKLPEDLRSTIVDPYFDAEANEARIQLRIRDSEPGLRRNQLVNEIRAQLDAAIPPSQGDANLVGALVLYNNLLQSLVASQIESFGAVIFGCGLMFYVLFWSVRLAIIGIIPNVLAAACVLGLMGWIGIPLDIMTITIAAIAIGIAVDNAIHYIYRFREEFAQNGDYVATLHICHATMGRAVLYTSVTIIFGFSILVFSNFFPTIYFGTLTGLAIAIALLAALTLLPRLILLAKPF
jgi:hypothetical protein